MEKNMSPPFASIPEWGKGKEACRELFLFLRQGLFSAIQLLPEPAPNSVIPFGLFIETRSHF